MDINDLPKKQRDFVIAKKPDAKMVYFFYAHLTEIKITQEELGEKYIAIGSILGTTGCTGNANTMPTINKGAHLHFEVRLDVNPRPKLLDRIDPKPFINHCN